MFKIAFHNTIPSKKTVQNIIFLTLKNKQAEKSEVIIYSHKNEVTVGVVVKKVENQICF